MTPSHGNPPAKLASVMRNWAMTGGAIKHSIIRWANMVWCTQMAHMATSDILTPHPSEQHMQPERSVALYNRIGQSRHLSAAARLYGRTRLRHFGATSHAHYGVKFTVLRKLSPKAALGVAASHPGQHTPTVTPLAYVMPELSSASTAVAASQTAFPIRQPVSPTTPNLSFRAANARPVAHRRECPLVHTHPHVCPVIPPVYHPNSPHSAQHSPRSSSTSTSFRFPFRFVCIPLSLTLHNLTARTAP